MTVGELKKILDNYNDREPVLVFYAGKLIPLMQVQKVKVIANDYLPVVDSETGSCFVEFGCGWGPGLSIEEVKHEINRTES